MSDGNGGAPSGDAGQQQGSNGDAGGFDAGALTGQLAEMQQSQEQLREAMTQQFQQFQEQFAPQADEGAGFDPNAPLDLSGLDEAGYDTAPVEQVTALWQERMNQALEAQRNEFQKQFEQYDQRLSEREMTEQLRDFAGEFPEIQQREVAEKAFRNAQDYAVAHGMPAELAGNVGFVRAIYMAEKAADVANTEGNEPEDTAHLEGGGGAGAAQQLTTQEGFQQMLQQGGGGNVLPF